jgi:hypothetical protein
VDRVLLQVYLTRGGVGAAPALSQSTKEALPPAPRVGQRADERGERAGDRVEDEQDRRTQRDGRGTPHRRLGVSLRVLVRTVSIRCWSAIHSQSLLMG